jgi:hypothetical protein
MTSSGPEQMPSSSPAPGEPPAVRSSRDHGAPRLADLAVAVGALLYLVCALVAWYRVDAFDLGSGYRVPAVSVNGFDSGMVVLAFVLLVLAAAWALLPAFADVRVPFPRAVLTVALAALAFLLTLFEWLSDLDIGFSPMGFLTLMASLAVLAFAALRLVPPVGGGGAVPGGLAAAARWADRPAPRFGRRRDAEAQPAPAPGEATADGGSGTRTGGS